MLRRNVLPMLVLVGLILACFSTKARTEANIAEASEEHVIPLLAGNSPVDPNNPRVPITIPVSCFLDDVSGNLYFSFLFPMGDVTITLTEASAGVVSTNDYSTSSCFVAVPVPGPGTFSISVLLDSGTEYTGQFVY